MNPINQENEACDTELQPAQSETGSSHVLYVSLQEAGYKKDKAVVSDIQIEVSPGEMVGLIGPNGAGKSTTIKSILGLTIYRKGIVQFGGEKQRYAYVPEQPVYYEYFTLWEHLRMAAAAFHISEQKFVEKAEQLLTLFRLSKQRHAYPAKFSKGMQQKLMLIIAFLLEPDVYIVDEPFVGLDPRATLDLLELLSYEQKRGAGVLICTHVLDTAERICDKYVLINQGKNVASGQLSDVRIAAGLPTDATLFECFHVLTQEEEE